MHNWDHKKLIREFLKTNTKYSNAIDKDDEIAFKKYGKKLNNIESELMRRLEMSDNERRKVYKQGYDQGRFDEDADRTYKTGRYERGRI